VSSGRRGGVDQYVVISGGASNPNLIAGTVNPAAGGGIVAPEGSIFMRFVAGAGQTYVKTGAAATAWTLMGFAGSGGSSILAFGADSVGAGADTRFLPFGWEGGTAQTISAAAFRSPRAGTLRNMRVRHNAANGNGNPVVYTLRINAVPTALSASLASGAIGDASDLVNTVTVASGDLIGMQAVKALAIGSGNQDSMVSMELV